MRTSTSSPTLSPTPATTSPPSRPARALARIAALLTGRRSAWAVLVVAALLALALMGLRGSGPAAGMDALPASAESSRAAAVADQLPDADQQTVMAVVTRTDGGKLTADDEQQVAHLRSALADATDGDELPPMPSEDGRADLVLAPIDTGAGDDAVDAKVADLRELAHAAVSGDLQVQLTGGPAVGSDIRGAFAGADFRLLIVTIAVVGVLLLLTYRSPVLWLLPLAVVGAADGVASAVTSRMGETFSLAFDAGVISVLVFGAGANYALLLISRYREELHRSDDHRAALRRAWSETAPAVVASNVTVVLALLTLVLAVMPATRGLGIAAAVGLVIALLAVLFPLTALLAITGRRVFWPFVPRPAQSGEDAGEAPSASGTGTDDAERGVFAAVARRVTARPVLSVIGTLAVLAVCATGLLGTRVGLSQSEQFASANESQTGFTAIAEHYGAGQSGPHLITAPTSDAKAVTTAAKDVPGVESVTESGTTPGGETVLSATGTAQPESPAADQEVLALRDAVHGVTPEALVGGTSAQALDVHDDSMRDLLLIAPIILGVILVVLVVLLRALVAPLVLLAANLVSTLASIGLGLWVGRTLFDIPALDVTVPLLAFLFLAALGVDYTIFLTHRIRREAERFGTVHGTVRAVGSTGVVITSAGIVLAAVFAALGVLPLVVLGQLGLIVGLGVLVDTVLVRTVLVPALFSLIGDRMWWPGRLGARSDRHAD
ncbi:MMPL family transporter [Brachybacterium halotolerans subsp. kimchii]|uniref:MMPL family transporter n=1 Tax=Brachybacterium halotolerans TaxID=2795215 RepID=UPI001E50C366|nr:MMPL family transporter [Brachybacterium halotolerans]UEJ81665.1 MMPL family transporter [Brachybacterium halotolerans subsp. kimchii]